VIPGKAFYIDPDKVNGDTFELDREESLHASRVLRLKPNDEICLLDGTGTGFHALINSVVHDRVSGVIREKKHGLGENRISIILAPAMIKRDRFEILLEKATELGVNEIHPLVLDRCVKKTINTNRCQKIVTASAKQCRRSRFPVVKDPKDLETWINTINGPCIAGSLNGEKTISQLNLGVGQPIHIIIGPEGDFSDQEIKKMKKAGVQFYSLGERRLRAETAALATLSVLNEIMN
jgi:16S rRNA (uracil1498-N3)-methyltransferase